MQIIWRTEMRMSCSCWQSNEYSSVVHPVAIQTWAVPAPHTPLIYNGFCKRLRTGFKLCSSHLKDKRKSQSIYFPTPLSAQICVWCSCYTYSRCFAWCPRRPTQLSAVRCCFIISKSSIDSEYRKVFKCPAVITA